MAKVIRQSLLQRYREPTMGSVSISFCGDRDRRTHMFCFRNRSQRRYLVCNIPWTNDTQITTLRLCNPRLDSSISSPDDIITCTVTFTDNNSASISDSATILIENSTPSLIWRHPSHFFWGVYGCELTCSATASVPMTVRSRLHMSGPWEATSLAVPRRTPYLHQIAMSETASSVQQLRRIVMATARTPLPSRSKIRLQPLPPPHPYPPQPTSSPARS